MGWDAAFIWAGAWALFIGLCSLQNIRRQVSGGLLALVILFIVIAVLLKGCAAIIPISDFDRFNRYDN